MQLFERTLGEWLEYWVEKTPDKEFIVYSDRDLRFTYKQFDQRVNNLAKGLLSIGVTTGSHVGIWATNVPDWLTFLFASAKIGAVLVTVNTNYKQHELEYLTDNADLHTLCISNGTFDSDYVDMTYTMLPELRTSQRGNMHSERFPFMKNVIYIGQEKHRGMYNTAELLLLGQTQDNEKLEACRSRFNCHDVVNMQYTSGTTGFPKGVMLTHHNITNNGYCIGQCMKFTENDRVCLPVPLFHCFGIVLGIMAIITNGACAVMLERFDPLVVLASVHKERCTALYGVPTMFIAELNHPMFSMFDLSSLRTGIMAGSLCPEWLMREVMDKMYMTEITSVYGLTETSPGMTQSKVDDPLEVRATTVGSSLPEIDVKVIDPETILQNARSNSRNHRQKRIPALGRPRCKDSRRKFQNYRTHQRYDYPRWRKYLPTRNRRIPLSITSNQRCAGCRRSFPKIRRRSRCVYYPERWRDTRRSRCKRFLQRKDFPP